MRNPLLEPYPHPGKYEGELNLTERLDADGFADEELGDVEAFGHYQLFTDLHLDVELGDLQGIQAAILHTNSQGFVSATWYDDVQEAREAWAALEQDYADFCDDEEDC